MASGRHKLVLENPPSRRLFRIALPISLATLVTGTVVGAAVIVPSAATPPTSAPVPSATVPAVHAVLMAAGSERDQEQISRSTRRVTLEARPEPAPPQAVGHRFMTARLNVWSGPGETFRLLDVLPSGTRVAVTGRTQGEWAQIVRDGTARWVRAGYLSTDKPQPAEPATPTATARAAEGLSTGSCPAGSSIESGITANAAALYRAVCAQFPQVTTYGGWRGDGEHSSGRAIDIMVAGSLGQAIADWLRANAGALRVSDIIWAQRIWTGQRGSEGWRWMENRGSTTANHYDHVHVQVY